MSPLLLLFTLFSAYHPPVLQWCSVLENRNESNPLHYNSITLKLIWKDTRASAISLSRLKGLLPYSSHYELLLEGAPCSFSKLKLAHNGTIQNGAVKSKQLGAWGFSHLAAISMYPLVVTIASAEGLAEARRAVLE